MAELECSVRVSFERIRFTVDEDEIRALDALTGYSDDAFIKHFKEQLGTAYIQDHEAGLRKFFQTIRSIASSEISIIDRARHDLKEAKEKRKEDFSKGNSNV